MSAGDGFNYSYIQAADAERVSDSELEIYDDVAVDSGYYYYRIDELKYENVVNSETHSYSNTFTSANALRNARPCAICHSNGEFIIYNYYSTTGRILKLARLTTTYDTDPSGATTETTSRISTFAMTKLISYKGNMKYFGDYDEMEAWLRNTYGCTASGDEQSPIDYTQYQYRLKFYLYYKNWRSKDFAQNVEGMDYEGTLELYSKYPIYREVKSFDTVNIAMGDYARQDGWPKGKKMHIAFGIVNKCEMIMKSNIAFSLYHNEELQGSGYACHESEISASKNKSPNPYTSYEVAVTDMYAYGDGDLPGPAKTVEETNDSAVFAVLPGWKILTANDCTYGLHAETFDTSQGEDLYFEKNGQRYPLSDYAYIASHYEVIADNNPDYASYAAWVADMANSSQAAPVANRSPKDGKITVAKVDSTAQYEDQQGNMHNYDANAQVPIQHDSDNGLDYMELYTDYKEGEVDTSSGSFGGLGDTQRGNVRVYVGDKSGGVDGMSYGSSLDVSREISVSYTEGSTTVNASFSVKVKNS